MFLLLMPGRVMFLFRNMLLLLFLTLMCLLTLRAGFGPQDGPRPRPVTALQERRAFVPSRGSSRSAASPARRGPQMLSLIAPFLFPDSSGPSPMTPLAHPVAPVHPLARRPPYTLRHVSSLYFVSVGYLPSLPLPLFPRFDAFAWRVPGSVLPGRPGGARLGLHPAVYEASLAQVARSAFCLRPGFRRGSPHSTRLRSAGPAIPRSCLRAASPLPCSPVPCAPDLFRASFDHGGFLGPRRLPSQNRDVDLAFFDGQRDVARPGPRHPPPESSRQIRFVVARQVNERFASWRQYVDVDAGGAIPPRAQGGSAADVRVDRLCSLGCPADVVQEFARAFPYPRPDSWQRQYLHDDERGLSFPLGERHHQRLARFAGRPPAPLPLRPVCVLAARAVPTHRNTRPCR